MRAGFSADLEMLLRRADPAAGLFVDAEVIAAEDLKQRRDQFEAADSLTGLEVLDDGVRLVGSGSTLINLATGADNMTGLEGPLHDGSFSVAALDYGSAADKDRVITELRAHLDPTADGGQPQEVVTWICELHVLVEQDEDPAGPGDFYRLRRIARATAAAVASTQDITFSFAGGFQPQPGLVIPKHRQGGTPPNNGQPRCYVFIWGVKADGSLAGNTAWVVNGASSSGSGAGITVTRHTLVKPSANGAGDRFSLFQDNGSQLGVPRIRVDSKTYTQAIIAFTGAGNRLDLGATPTEDVIFAIAGETPAGTALVGEVRNDADTAWVPFVDGQLVDELAGVTKQQFYKVRATLTPNAGGTVTPTLRTLGARRTTRVEIPEELVRFEGGQWAFDPHTLKPSIPDIRFSVLRDGQRDFRDLISDLLSSHHLGDVRFRLWWGARSLSRAFWLHVDDLVIDDVEGGGAALRLICLSEYAQLRQVLPVPTVDGADVVRDPLSYAQQSLKAAWDDLLDNQVGLPARLKGPGPEDTTTTVSKVITDSEVKPELDAIAFLAGGIVTTRQGRITYIPVHGQPKVPIAIFPAEEIRVLGVTPGFRARLVEYFVPFNYDFEEREFRSEVRTFHGPALTKMGRALLEADTRLDELVAQWIITQSGDQPGESSLAEAVGDRQIQTLGTGLLQIDFVSDYPYPEFFLGDVIAVQIDHLVLRDPNFDLALRGEYWAVGVIRAVDLAARTFSVWVQSLADLFGDVEYVLRDEYAIPKVEHFTEPIAGNPGQLRVRLEVRPPNATVKYVVQDAGDAVPPVGDAAYTTYTNPFTVDRLEATARQLTYYGENGARRSARRTMAIDPDTEPEVTLTLSEPAAGTLRVSWLPDDDVVWVHLYRAIDNATGSGWPTTDGLLTGTLDDQWFIGRIHVRPDGGAFDVGGGPLAGMSGGQGVGGTTWEDGTVFTGGEEVKVIAVPLDRVGNTGPRASASRTMDGATPTASITSFSAAKASSGTGCGDVWTVDLDWMLANATDGGHDLVLSFRRDGGPWNTLVTETSPVSVTTTEEDMEDFEDASGATFAYDFRAELVPNGGGAPIDTKTDSLTIRLSGTCPLS